MCFDDGTPVILDDGERVTFELQGQEPDVMARILTKEIRAQLNNELVPGFSRDLDYPANGVV